MKRILEKLNRFFYSNLRLAVLDETAGRWVVNPSPEIIPYLKSQNCKGKHILLKPAAHVEPYYMLVDDIGKEVLNRQHLNNRGKWKSGRLIVETSPNNYQVWIHSSRYLSIDEKKFWLKKLNSDPGANPKNRWGRCPGFRNRKIKYKDINGGYPLSKLVWIDWKEKADIPYVSTFVMYGRNAIVSINYQHLYNFRRSWDFDYNHPAPQFEWPMKVDFDQDGALYALGLAFCTEISRDLTFGLTLNIWDDLLYDNQWEQKQHMIGEIIGNGLTGSYHVYARDQYSHQGMNANLGILWRITQKWRLGCVIKLPFKATIDHQQHVKMDIDYDQNNTSDVHTTENETFEEHLYMPLSYGIGLEYRVSKNFTISGDLYRTHWDGFKYENHTGIKTSPISGLNMDISDIDTTTSLRFGAEYIKVGKQFAVPFRAGLFYDPAPSEGSPDSYYGFSLGSGVAFKKYIVDMAYQFRTGNDVGDSMMKDLNFSQDIREHTLYVSVIYHF